MFCTALLADDSTFEDVSSCFLSAAEKYRERHGRPVVLVLDGMNYIAASNQALAGVVIDKAKVSER